MKDAKDACRKGYETKKSEAKRGDRIYLMNVPRRYSGTPEGEKCWFSLQGRLEGFLGSCCTGPRMQPRKVGMME